MTLKTILRFQFGNADAIREVAQSRAALPTGIILVLLTSIARNYDQTYILEKPFLWLFGSLIFSIASGTLIFGIVYFILWIRNLPKERPGIAAQYLSFLGLFWMTAPIAWLYALPVERFLGSYQAAQANLTLLAIVALWRVLLLARVFSIVCETPLWRTCLWVLIPASMEVIALYIVGVAKIILEGMGGMQNSPEENLLFDALRFSATGGFWIGITAIVLLAIFKNRKPLSAFPKHQVSRMPVTGLVIVSVFWIGIAIYPQTQVNRSAQVEQLIENDQYKEALEFLSAHEEKDFAPARQLPPKPYESRIYKELPKIIEAMDGSEKDWVRQKYFRYLEIMIDHDSYFLNRDFDAVKQNIERLPGGTEWLKRNEQKFTEFIEKNRPKQTASDTNSVPILIITNATVAP